MNKKDSDECTEHIVKMITDTVETVAWFGLWALFWWFLSK